VAGIAGSLDLTLVIAGGWYHGAPWYAAVDRLPRSLLARQRPHRLVPPGHGTRCRRGRRHQM